MIDIIMFIILHFLALGLFIVNLFEKDTQIQLSRNILGFVILLVAQLFK